MPGISNQMPRTETDLTKRVRALEQLVGTIIGIAGNAAALAQAIQTGLGNLASSGTTWAGPVNSPSTVAAATNITAGGNITSSGQVYSQQPLKSPGSVTYHVSTGYVATWTNGDGTIGTSTSSGAVKTSLTPMTQADADRLLKIPAYWGRYVWDDPASPLKAFLLAEDVQAAGFGPDVAPIVPAGAPMNIGSDENPVILQPGQAWTVNYSQLVPSLVAGYQSLSDRIAALEAKA